MGLLSSLKKDEQLKCDWCGEEMEKSYFTKCVDGENTTSALNHVRRISELARKIEIALPPAQPVCFALCNICTTIKKI